MSVGVETYSLYFKSVDIHASPPVTTILGHLDAYSTSKCTALRTLSHMHLRIHKYMQARINSQQTPLITHMVDGVAIDTRAVELLILASN